MADHRESNFVHEHPALIATIVTVGILGAFLGAIYVSATGHHHEPGHGSAAPSASGPSGVANPPAGNSAKPSPKK